MQTRLTFLRSAISGASLLLANAAFAQHAGQPMVLPPDPAPLIVDTGTTKERFQIEIADDEQERAAGLMFRENMAPDHGMLFVYDREQPVTFWMHNTILPLDLVFIDKTGKVVGVEQGKPYSDDAISPGAVQSQFVLELNAGTAAKIGLDAGDIIHHPAIGNALPN